MLEWTVDLLIEIYADFSIGQNDIELLLLQWYWYDFFDSTNASRNTVLRR